MGIDDIIFLVRLNLRESIFIFLGIIALFYLGYAIIYKGLLRGKKTIKFSKLIVSSILISYILIVVMVTLTDKGMFEKDYINTHLFSSYRQTWNEWSDINWEFQIINILIFLPFGFLLPILSDRFKAFKNTFYLLLVFSFSLEIIQFITASGVFALDHILNNLIGGIVGYTIIMSLYSLFKEKNIQKSIGLLMPVLSLVLVLGGIYSAYDSKELGNLATDPNYKLNMRNVKLVNNRSLSDEREMGNIYKARGYSRKESLNFAREVFGKLGADLNQLNINEYDKEIVYRLEDYSLSVNKLDRSYFFTDYSTRIEKPTVWDEDVARMELTKYNIVIPKEAVYEKADDMGMFIVENNVKEDGIVSGILSLSVYDNKIGDINNNIVSYEKYKTEELRSSQEAYQDILDGKFNYYRDDFKNIEVIDISEDYILDSKGYYQPVYIFDLSIDDDFSYAYIRRVEDR